MSTTNFLTLIPQLPYQCHISFILILSPYPQVEYHQHFIHNLCLIILNINVEREKEGKVFGFQRASIPAHLPVEAYPHGAYQTMSTMLGYHGWVRGKQIG